MLSEAPGNPPWKRSKYPLQHMAVEASKKPISSSLLASQPLRDKTAATPEPPCLTSTTHNQQLNSPLSQSGMSNYPPKYSSSGNIKMDGEAGETMSISSHSSSLTNSTIGTYHDATTMSPIEEKGKEEVEQQQQDEPSTPDQRTRSLRRSQRSQRLEARLSKSNMQAAAQSPQSTDKSSEESVMEAITGDRQDHPEGVASSLLAVLKHSLPSPANESDVKQNIGGHQFRNRDRGLPASPPSSESETDSTKSSRVHHKDGVQGAKTRNRKYPLQAPTPGADSQGPPTPPSPAHETEHPLAKSQGLHNSSAQASSATLTPRQQTYPLQSPASNANLQQSNQQPAKAPAALDSTKLRETSTVNTEEKTTTTASKTKSTRRQAYPLQSPASIANLRAANSSSDQGHLGNGSQPQPDPARPSHSRRLSQGKYPLQFPLNVTIPSQSPSPSESGHSSRSPQQNEPAKVAKKPGRRGYPLQAPASHADLRSASLSTDHDSQTQNGQNSRDDTTVTSPGGTRRQRYPLQPLITSPTMLHSRSFSTSSAAPSESSTEDGSSGPYPPPPYLREEQDTPTGQTPKRFLPKNIRAVRNTDEELKGRTIVVCLDGTGDKFDDDNSNIVHLVSALKKDDSHQVTYYQAGIGTYNDGGLSSGFNSALDMAVGSGLGLHVRDAYQFLMHSYKEGDRICIFGFSRGAYTARCLAGMIHKVGLLPARNLQQIQFAYEFYKDDSEHGWKQSEDFKRAFSIEVNVHFIGCFDSVASVGFIPRQLPLSSTPNSKARYFRHAMALDERRAKFKICRYQAARSRGQWDKASDDSGDENKVMKPKSQNDVPPRYSARTAYGKSYHPNMTEAEYDRLYGHEENFDTDVSEVWFAGCHADVGGGAVANTERHKLAQIPLRWMIRQTFECNTGIIFKTRMLAEYGLDVHSLWPRYGRLDVPGHAHSPLNFLRKYEKKLPPKSIRRSKLVPVERREHEYDQGRGLDQSDHHGEPWYHFQSPDDEDWTPEQVEDYYDAMTPLNDQLIQAPTWWILEALPVQYKMCYEAGKVVTVTGPNMGLARLVEDHDAQIHWTVLQRAQKLQGYRAAARPALHTEWRVVS